MTHYTILFKMWQSLSTDNTDQRLFDRQLKAIMYGKKPKHLQHRYFWKFKNGKVKNFQLKWVKPVSKFLETDYLVETLEGNL